MELKIYDKYGNLRLTASPNSSSSLTEEVGGECSVSAVFTHTGYVPLDVDDYIEIDSVRYRIRNRYRPKQKNTQKYEYSVKFYAPIHDAEDAMMLFLEGDITSEFNYDGDPMEHLQLWIDNMNRAAGVNRWSIGTVVSAENKTIEYKNLKCWDAAFGSNGIAATFETEMWADGYVINLCRAERGERIELGYLQGLTNLAQEDNGEVEFYTRLFPLGSTRNIDASKYGYSRLQLPSRAKYVDQLTYLYGVKEHWEESAFSGIYPKYEGTVTSVRTEERENEDGRKYTVYFFTDSGMSFNPDDYAIPEYTYMLAFQTGELSGRGNEEGSFEAAWHNETKEWEIINVYPDSTTQLPGGVIIPQPGDKYIPWNFSLPQEYITAAEQAYEQAVYDFLASYNFDPNKYSGQTDRNYIERNGIRLYLGLNVRLLSEQYFNDTGYKDSRITRIVRKLNDLCQATITCCDKIGTGWKSSVDNQLDNLQYILTKQEQQAIIDIIKTTDNKTPSDYNVLSALKAISMSHRKDKTDENPYLQKFLKGIELGKFVSGLLGTGGAIQIDQDGNSHAEFDYLTIRKIATFIELIIQEAKYVGGMLVVSPSGMTVSKVEETGTAYRCYFERTDGDRTLQNRFTVGTQARRQTFNLTEQAYYWRLVTAVGDDYVDLSKTDCDAGSTVPQAGDEIVGLGHRTDKTRQSAIIISAYGSDSPSLKYYQGIDSYSLEEKAIRMDYFDPVSGRYKSVTYGDTYLGAPDKSTYLNIDQDGAEFAGRVKIQAGSTGASNIADLGGYISDNVQIGAENILLNSGFTGDYETEDLSSDKQMEGGTELYSPKLKYWEGEATVQEDGESASGYSAAIGSLSQKLVLIDGERYTVSIKARGKSLTLSLNAEKITIQLEEEYRMYTYQFTGQRNSTFSISGDATVCEPKLERGTIHTDWCPSRNDRNAVADEFRKYWYLMDALAGTTRIDGGLILTSIVRLGQWQDGELRKVNACISGIYNDDDDVALCGGGDLDKAIYTVMLYRDDPTYEPTEEELSNIANVVMTHGGRMILNDVIARGYIYAKGGVFRGKVYAEGGEFTGTVNATDGVFRGTVYATDGEFAGVVYANGGSFTGTVHATSGEFYGKVTATSGVFNGTVNANAGYFKNVSVSNINTSDDNFYIDGEGNVYVRNISATGGNFTDISVIRGDFANIDVDGLTAVNADISGKVTATSGSFSNVSVSNINTENDNFHIDKEGKVFVKYVNATGGNFKDIDVDGITAVNADITGRINATSGSFKNVTIEASIRSPWKTLSYGLIYSSSSGDIYGYDGSAVSDDRIIISSGIGGAELLLAWGDGADGRTVYIYVKTDMSITVKVPSGKYMIKDNIKHNGGSSVSFSGNSIYILQGFIDSWIVSTYYGNLPS